MKLGEIIKFFRKKNEMTMQEFADRAGLSKGYISMLEKSQHPQSQRRLVPSFETYLKVASAMSMSIDELVALLDDNETVRLNESSSSSPDAALAEQEAMLLLAFRKLNGDGKTKVIEYTKDLSKMEKYQDSSPIKGSFEYPSFAASPPLAAEAGSECSSDLEAQLRKDADEIVKKEYEKFAKAGSVIK